MKVFSIKDLASRIAKAQNQSNSNIADRISTIQNRINGVYEKISLMGKFSTRLAQSVNSVKNNRPLRENEPNLENGKIIEKKITGSKENAIGHKNSNFNSKIENVLLKRFLQKGTLGIQSDILTNLAGTMVPKLAGLIKKNNHPNNHPIEENKSAQRSVYEKNRDTNKSEAISGFGNFFNSLDNQNKAQ